MRVAALAPSESRRPGPEEPRKRFHANPLESRARIRIPDLRQWRLTASITGDLSRRGKPYSRKLAIEIQLAMLTIASDSS